SRTAPYETYTLSLHDALPIYALRTRLPRAARLPHGRTAAARTRAHAARTRGRPRCESHAGAGGGQSAHAGRRAGSAAEPPRPRADRKSTRLNSSHVKISYAVF